ncbi:MAG: hypothetical protein LAT67_10570 [Balneolales bacterium]|nr:hypothetical protein [Balneolales bacterium]
MNTITIPRERYYLITVKATHSQLFQVRAEKFAFLNIWRIYTGEIFKTCSYVIVQGTFKAIVKIKKTNLSPVTLENELKSILKLKMLGIFTDDLVELMSDHLNISELFTEKECIYTCFDIHVLPQQSGLATDYRTYPFSSYQALTSNRETLLDKVSVYHWFGSRHRFALFHQAYYGWIQPGNTTTQASTPNSFVSP